MSKTGDPIGEFPSPQSLEESLREFHEHEAVQIQAASDAIQAEVESNPDANDDPRLREETARLAGRIQSFRMLDSLLDPPEFDPNTILSETPHPTQE